LHRTLDLWTGVQTSRYQIDGSDVTVETCVHPKLNMVAVRIASPLVESGALEVALDFAYPTVNNAAWVGDFNHVAGHSTKGLSPRPGRIDLKRTVDAAEYCVALEVAEGGAIRANDGGNAYVMSARGHKTLAFACAFSPQDLPPNLPPFGRTSEACAARWQNFWQHGGAIDLSASKDPRWKELERRIVLSQYQMAAQSAGSWPPAETGLLGLDDWRGQFHMEMVWWHLAHYALWDRWEMAYKALGCYQRFIPTARELAIQLGYKGLQWGKECGPEGRSAPWAGNHALLWKCNRHPIFVAELEYRLKPTRETLDKWAEIVNGTAEYMADCPKRDATTGIYSLDPAMPPSEQGFTKNDVFDLQGINTGGPCPYLPGNGGLLYAAAMMAAGWDGAPQRHAPGFPADGSWVVKWEGLKTAP